jgi:hypothetical protein
MNLLLEQLIMHVGAMKHVAALAKVEAWKMSASDLAEAEKRIDEIGWALEEVLEATAEAVTDSMMPAVQDSEMVRRRDTERRAA